MQFHDKILDKYQFIYKWGLANFQIFKVIMVVFETDILR